MTYQEAHNKLSSIGQTHLLKFWDTLTDSQKQKLLVQIDKLDTVTFQQQKELLIAQNTDRRHISPFYEYISSGNYDDYKRGKELISSGQVGCLIIAGGQGSRLRFDGPKGMFPVTPIKNKTLFQLFAEKVLAASKQAGRPLPLAIMTSPLNHDETITFFKINNLFGLAPEQLSIFQQEMLPLLDEQMNLFLEDQGTIAEGPDGNGGALHHFYHNGIWETWHHSGVRFLNFILIDNPLADPFDAELIGYQERIHCDIVVKCTLRNDATESVGVLAKENNQVVVVEYSEMSNDERQAKTNDGTLLYKCANLSLFSFTMDFIQNSVAGKYTPPMPLHLAHKAVKHLDAFGHSVKTEKPAAWKFEKFIFDLLPYAPRVEALLYPRETCFAPLKNFRGPYSIETVKEALIANDRRAFEQVSGNPCMEANIEVSQEFYYPTDTLRNKWKGKLCPSGYVEA